MAAPSNLPLSVSGKCVIKKEFPPSVPAQNTSELSNKEESSRNPLSNSPNYDSSCRLAQSSLRHHSSTYTMHSHRKSNSPLSPAAQTSVPSSAPLARVSRSTPATSNVAP